MRRTVLAAIFGCLLGYAAAQWPGATYTYHEAFSADEARVLINAGRWETVPGQPDPLYLRHPTAH